MAQHWIDEIKENTPNVLIIPIILQCTLETHRTRIEERGRTNKEHLNLGGEALDDVMHKYEFIEKLDRPDLIRLDANGSAESVYQSALKLLQEHVDSLKS